MAAKTREEIIAMVNAGEDPAIIAQHLAHQKAQDTMNYFLLEIENPAAIKLTISVDGWKDLRAFLLKPDDTQHSVGTYHVEYILAAQDAITAKDADAFLQCLLLMFKAYQRQRR